MADQAISKPGRSSLLRHGVRQILCLNFQLVAFKVPTDVFSCRNDDLAGHNDHHIYALGTKLASETRGAEIFCGATCGGVRGSRSCHPTPLRPPKRQPRSCTWSIPDMPVRTCLFAGRLTQPGEIPQSGNGQTPSEQQRRRRLRRI